MRHDFLDRYSRLSSPIHRLPAGVKFAFSSALVVTIMSVPFTSPEFYTAAALGLLLVAILSGIPPLFLIRRLLFLEPFVLGIALLSLLRAGGVTVFLAILAKSTLSLFTMILLSNTTPFSRILGVLRSLRMPPLMVTVLALMYRYLFVLIDEAERMTRARASRTFVPGRVRLWTLAASVISQMFIRSSERAERIYAAMISRGWK
jgi:cobalt/nickel transport system permease protein